MRRQRRSFWGDNRAIEGLPIRLIIALVVGVAALGLMLQVLDGFGGIGETEVTVEFEDGEVIELDDLENGEDVEIVLTVIDEDGNTVPDATVLLEPGTAQGDIMRHDSDDEEHIISLNDFEDNTSADLRSDQDRGTYEISILPPSDSDWVDEQSNPEIVLIRN